MSVFCVRPVRRLDVINVGRLRVTAAGFIKKHNTTQRHVVCKMPFNLSGSQHFLERVTLSTKDVMGLQ